jgi:hypothetical protein
VLYCHYSRPWLHRLFVSLSCGDALKTASDATPFYINRPGFSKLSLPPLVAGYKKRGRKSGSISPGPVISALLADWPEEKLKEAKESGSLLEASEVANVVMLSEKPS